jgi:hypothetical protein
VRRVACRLGAHVAVQSVVPERRPGTVELPRFGSLGHDRGAQRAPHHADVDLFEE